MKQADVYSKVFSIPEEGYKKEGYFDSDGEGDEDWKDDVAEQFDYIEDENEGKWNYTQSGIEAEKRSKKFLNAKLGKTVSILDKIAA